jgi:hypothetical protein
LNLANDWGEMAYGGFCREASFAESDLFELGSEKL